MTGGMTCLYHSHFRPIVNKARVKRGQTLITKGGSVMVCLEIQPPHMREASTTQNRCQWNVKIFPHMRGKFDLPIRPAALLARHDFWLLDISL